MLLKGKKALITGAARGIGRSCAMVLAEEGAAVGVADILPEVEHTACEIQDNGGRSAFAVFDVSDPAQVRDGVDKMRRTLGDFDILVNNAGLVANIARITRMTSESWQRELSVNLSGAFHMIQAVIGPMIDKKWGRIINVSSLAAAGGLHKQVGYASSKAGLLGLTKTGTLEHARDGITFNAVLPGLIETEQVRSMPGEIRANALAGIPSRRFGRMDEMGYLIAFLASDKSAYINGVSIPIDGGMGLNVSTLGSRREIKELETITD